MKISYKKAMEEIQQIMAVIESDHVDVDDLTLHLKRITELLKICKTKLSHAEEEAEKILRDLEQ